MKTLLVASLEHLMDWNRKQVVIKLNRLSKSEDFTNLALNEASVLCADPERTHNG